MAHNHLFWPNFNVYTTFYDLKIIFGYIGESPENFMSKIYTGSTSILRINIVSFDPNMAASQLSWIF